MYDRPQEFGGAFVLWTLSIVEILADCGAPVIVDVRMKPVEEWFPFELRG
jgi:hypothetical protein